MTTFGYAERPLGLTGPAARATVNERLAARGPVEDTGSLSVRGEGTSKRLRNRPHHNDPPPRPATPGGNAKPVGGRVAVPARPSMPAQSRRTGEPPAVADPSTTETAVLPAVPAAAPANTSTGYPSRPDPSDPATEVWALVERAQAGESEAFGLIYDRYVDTVFRFVYFRVGNRQLAEDLTSDTFLRALKRIGSFTWQGRDLGAWLVTIARNLVADHFKSGRYRLEVTTGDVLDADREDRGPEGSPEAAVVEHITNVALLSAVKQLNPEQQECIVLRFLQGFSVAETARAMGKNEGAIKALQYRAVRALARLLPDGFQP
ncbi:RNA polymerase subunit sigma-24 [Micromonospora sp. S4605]|uniref:RNA polymerase sigma-70 factor, ECF subfamily n=1 Tax=Micromonospora echinaurantiaca TaxID=47857 RepID=A0A1C5K0J3_9ACTN|nr:MULTISPECIES: ECF subfamily RNA polymerase sigma factor, BldN family [Micromonospora]PWU49717.1 RNA polymerase subunit sigma-24 [Micromonospora sp. S4605]SCG76344.1 RNA polymerase sigma-70 factor, ECF subfamily [Micromonospora echinaurantiaca]